MGLRKKKEIGFFVKEREMDESVYGERIGGFNVT